MKFFRPIFLFLSFTQSAFATEYVRVPLNLPLKSIAEGCRAVLSNDLAVAPGGNSPSSAKLVFDTWVERAQVRIPVRYVYFMDLINNQGQTVRLRAGDVLNILEVNRARSIEETGISVGIDSINIPLEVFGLGESPYTIFESQLELERTGEQFTLQSFVLYYGILGRAKPENFESTKNVPLETLLQQADFNFECPMDR